jgi:6-phosphogluconolactonase (cycloisomerase 2 family)
MDSDDAGNLLVSQVEGRVFRIAPDGTVTRLLDTSVPGRGACNFAFVPERGLLVVPTWTGNAVAAYSLAGSGEPLGRSPVAADLRDRPANDVRSARDEQPSRSAGPPAAR